MAEEGVLLQLNAESLLPGARRSRVGALARQLCSERVEAVVASDGHRAETRRPVTALAEAAAELERLVGAERARWMTCTAPGALISGAPVPPAPATSPSGRTLLARLRRSSGRG